jgi:hypothetical protein
MSNLISETTKPVLESSPGRSLITEIEKLREAVLALVDINRALCKKIEGNETKLTAIARFAVSQSDEKPNFEVI